MLPPRFYRPETAPAAVGGGGAAAAAQATAGAVHRLSATLGQTADTVLALQERSNALAAGRAWRQLDEWRLQYLRGLPGRRQDLSQTALDEETGQNVTGYQREMAGFADQMQGEYDRVAAGLSPHAKQMLQHRYDAYAPGWSNQALETLDHLELEDVTAEALDLAQQDRGSDARQLIQLHADRYSPADRQRLEKAIQEAGDESRLAAAQGYLQGVAKDSGWETARQMVEDPEFQKTWGLDLRESAQVDVSLQHFAASDKARRDEAVLWSAQRRLEEIAGAQGWQAALEQAEDPAWQKEQDLTLAESGELQRRLAGFAGNEKTRTEEKRRHDLQDQLSAAAAQVGWDAVSKNLNDPAFQREHGLEIGETATLKGQVETFVRDQSARAEVVRRSELEATNDKFLADAYEGKADLAALPALVRSNKLEAAVAQQVREIMTKPRAENDLEAFIEGERKLAAVRAQTLRPEEAIQWFRSNAGRFNKETWQQDIKDLLRVRDPADPLGRPNVVLLDKLLDDHYDTLATFGKYGTPEAERKYLEAKLRFRAVARDPAQTDEQLRQAYRDIVYPGVGLRDWARTQSLGGYLFGRLFGLAPGAEAGVAEAPQPTALGYQPIDVGREPRSPQEFTDTVKSLPKRSKEQADYYNRWVRKWQ